MKKTEIEERVRESHLKLLKALDGLTEEEATRVGLNPQWSIKDALAHVVAWELQGADTIREIEAGTWKPQRLNKEMIDEFNARAVEVRRELSMREVSDELNMAHSRMESLIAGLPDEIEESSPTYKFIEGVTFRHMTHHAAQIQEWRDKSKDEG
ncbi:MAG TPA: DinB family protein [Pyrinomonadaceae bacterium]|jgi:hypothetical protein